MQPQLIHVDKVCLNRITNRINKIEQRHIKQLAEETQKDGVTVGDTFTTMDGIARQVQTFLDRRIVNGVVFYVHVDGDDRVRMDKMPMTFNIWRIQRPVDSDKMSYINLQPFRRTQKMLVNFKAIR